MVVEQTKTPPSGLCGGRSGKPNIAILNAGAACETRLGKQSDVHLPAGGEWHLYSGGGGGWGDPHERDPRAVLGDVVNGYVSQESAQRDYGVIVRHDGARFVLDEPATTALRANSLRMADARASTA
jgi:N-methylhydantoinase B